jgi:hypothetical protein
MGHSLPKAASFVQSPSRSDTGHSPTDALIQAACDLTTWTQVLLLDGELAVANQEAAVSSCGT